MHKKRRTITRAAALFAAFGLATGSLAACSNEQAEDTAADTATTPVEAVEPVEVRVASLKGPTSMGIVKFMKDAESGATDNTYTFTMSGSPDEVVPGIIQGEYDIAMVPANVAAVLYNKTEGGISVIDINTLGVLYAIGGEEIADIGGLAGKTVYTTGKGASPEYVLNYLLDSAGIADQVTLEFKSEATEAAAALAADPSGVAVLPEPFVTATLMQNEALSRGVKLSDAWDGAQEDGSQLIQGVTIVRNEFLEEHPEAVDEFLSLHADSAEYVNSNVEEASELVVEYGIMEKAPAAAKAIPNCSLVAIAGDDMADALAGYLAVLFDADPASVGGALPGDDLYLTDGAEELKNAA